MYPFPVVLIGPQDGLPELGAVLTGCAAKLAGQYSDVRAVRAARPASEPTVFLVRLRGEDDLHHLRALSDTFPGSPLVGLVEGPCDPGALYRVNRAGASQLVPVPWAPGDLAEALDRVARQYGRVPPLGKLIAVCGVAGGSGATSLVVNLGFELASRWHKACILAEPAAPIGRLASYVDIRSPRPTTDLFDAADPPDLQALTHALTPVADGILVLAAPPPSFPVRSPSTERVEAVVAAARLLAEVVLLDLQALDDTAFRLLAQADEVLLVSDASVPGLQALRMVREAVAARAGAGPVRLVVNRFHEAEGFTVSRLREALGADQVWTVADDPAGFTAAINAGRPLRAVAAGSAALSDIDRLAIELFGPPPSDTPTASGFRRWLGG